MSTLSDQVSCLARQVEVLRIAIDDLREEVSWALRNMTRPAWTPTPTLTSMPRDALAEDFASKVNRTRPEDLPAEPDAPVSSSTATSGAQKELF